MVMGNVWEVLKAKELLNCWDSSLGGVIPGSNLMAYYVMITVTDETPIQP